MTKGNKTHRGLDVKETKHNEYVVVLKGPRTSHHNEMVVY